MKKEFINNRMEFLRLFGVMAEKMGYSKAYGESLGYSKTFNKNTCTLKTIKKILNKHKETYRHNVKTLSI